MVFIFHHLIRDCCWFGCLAASQIADADNVRMTAFGREPLLAALKLAAVEGLLCGQDRTVAFFHDV
jgi:hypothetical protein